MKKGYIKILILETILIFVILFDNFKMDKLNNYSLIMILVLGFCIFRLFLGREKSNYRNTKDIMLNVIIYSIIVLALITLGGVFIGFVKIPSYWSNEGLVNFIVPTFLKIIVMEIFRHALLQKSEGSKLLIITTTIMFIIVDLILNFNSSTFTTSYGILMFIAYYVLPKVAKNILCTYLSIKTGYKPCIVYRLIMELHLFIFPYYSNYGDYINSMIEILIPSILLFISFKSLHENKKEDNMVHENGALRIIGYTISTILIGAFIYLTSGYFQYYIIAIGSGSMVPSIKKGDMVLIEKLKDDEKTDLEVGNIIAYKYHEITIVHRIVDVYKDKDDIVVYTKGDANESVDNYPIYSDMIVGKVDFCIPYIGYPAVMVNENIMK